MVKGKKKILLKEIFYEEIANILKVDVLLEPVFFLLGIIH